MADPKLGLDALFDDDLDESDSDDEDYEVDENEESDDDDDDAAGAASSAAVVTDGGGGGGGAAAVATSGSSGAPSSSAGLAELIQKASQNGDQAELARLLQVAATPVVRKLPDGTDAPPVPAFHMDTILHTRDDWDVAPLHAAILSRSIECVEMLIAKRASVDDRHEGFTYLHTAIAMGTLRANRDFSEKCVARLLAEDADVDIEDPQVRWRGSMPPNTHQRCCSTLRAHSITCQRFYSADRGSNDLPPVHAVKLLFVCL